MKCNICKYENSKEEHYCKNCGKNLSNTIEKTDIIFLVSKVLIFISVFIIIVMMISSCFVYFLTSLSRDKITIGLEVYIVCIIGFIVGHMLKIYALKLCKRNISNIQN